MTLKSLLQHHSSKASILRCSAFFTVQLSHPYTTTGKIIPLTRWTFVGKVISLLFNMPSQLVITFLPRSKSPLILMYFVTIINKFLLVRSASVSRAKAIPEYVSHSGFQISFCFWTVDPDYLLILQYLE